MPPHTCAVYARHKTDILHFGCRRLRSQVCRRTTSLPPHQRAMVPVQNHGQPNRQHLPRPDHLLKLCTRICQHLHAQLCLQSPAQVPAPGTEMTNTLAVQIDSASIRLPHPIRKTSGHQPSVRRQRHKPHPKSGQKTTLLCTRHRQHCACHTWQPWQRTNTEHQKSHHRGNPPPKLHGDAP